MRRHRIRVLIIVPIAVLSLALTGCGGPDKPDGGDRGGSGAGATGPGSDHDKRVKFASCMRENGVDMPDPEANPGGTVAAARAVDVADAAAAAAFEKCRSLLPNGGEVQPPSAEERERRLKFSQCMRANGVEDFPDPPADPRAGIAIQAPDQNDPAAVREWDDAVKKCGGQAGRKPAGE